mmetsp:Transcript_30358/g.40069  ORF Transcript_30358/g.40069 Transcript_30358/m.40069 type:complete len:214 (-) Transcript_30358:214-855(-)
MMKYESSKTYDHFFKFLLVGNAGVGKSSILKRLADDSFEEHLGTTIGVDFKVKWMDVDSKKIKLTIWDTAGQEKFRTLTSSYYRGSQGILLVYDVTNKRSFSDLERWLQEIETYVPNGGRDVVKLLVGNKIDKEHGFPQREVEAWARSKGMSYVQTSARTKIGIEQAFVEVVKQVLERPILLMNTGSRKSNQKILLSKKRSDECQITGPCCNS